MPRCVVGPKPAAPMAGQANGHSVPRSACASAQLNLLQELQMDEGRGMGVGIITAACGFMARGC